VASRLSRERQLRCVKLWPLELRGVKLWPLDYIAASAGDSIIVEEKKKKKEKGKNLETKPSIAAVCVPWGRAEDGIIAEIDSLVQGVAARMEYAVANDREVVLAHY
jgi:hypothetical protein